MKILYLAGLVVCGMVACSCSDAPAPTNKIDSSQVEKAAQTQGGNKAQNGGGVMPVADPGPPPGARTGAPDVGGKSGGN
jgi:hypothetical protein